MYSQDDDKYDITWRDLNLLNQLKCHILLNGNKLGIQKPLQNELEIKAQKPRETDFAKEIENHFECEPQWIDFYHAAGSKDLDDKKKRLLIYKVDEYLPAYYRLRN